MGLEECNVFYRMKTGILLYYDKGISSTRSLHDKTPWVMSYITWQQNKYAIATSSMCTEIKTGKKWLKNMVCIVCSYGKPYMEIPVYA
jgi:hypothetical protein